MQEQLYIVSVDTMISVKAQSEEEAIERAKAKFKDNMDDLELLIEEITDEL